MTGRSRFTRSGQSNRTGSVAIPMIRPGRLTPLVGKNVSAARRVALRKRLRLRSVEVNSMSAATHCPCLDVAGAAASMRGSNITSQRGADQE